ncbi:MAG: hypothetical protein IJR97_14065 [Clostridia bacterium]|nr:hypothetical protein [Clostridia bacterium]
MTERMLNAPVCSAALSRGQNASYDAAFSFDARFFFFGFSFIISNVRGER